jgi:hypothetical protein
MPHRYPIFGMRIAYRGERHVCGCPSLAEGYLTSDAPRLPRGTSRLMPLACRGVPHASNYLRPKLTIFGRASGADPKRKSAEAETSRGLFRSLLLVKRYNLLVRRIRGLLTTSGRPLDPSSAEPHVFQPKPPGRGRNRALKLVREISAGQGGRAALMAFSARCGNASTCSEKPKGPPNKSAGFGCRGRSL